jgi:hypothetical protein
MSQELSPEQEQRLKSEREKIHAEMERGEADPIKAYQLGVTTGIEIGVQLAARNLREDLNGLRKKPPEKPE